MQTLAFACPDTSLTIDSGISATRESLAAVRELQVGCPQTKIGLESHFSEANLAYGTDRKANSQLGRLTANRRHRSLGAHLNLQDG
jgi:hypothetical protein